MNIVPKAPLFCDPIYNGAADPVVIWNSQENAWWMFYTNRRAYGLNIGFSFMHGTDIGIASSTDGGLSWLYRGTAQGLCYEPGRNTYWAPEIIEHEGVYHMYVSYVKGIPQNYDCGRDILHYTSRDLWNWTFESKLNLSSDRVIDACVIRLPDGHFKMWYKDERQNSCTCCADSRDLFNWEYRGVAADDCCQEGPNVFALGGYYWMIADVWDGLAVYRSEDLTVFTRQEENILRGSGTRDTDRSNGSHADVFAVDGKAYIVYFTYPCPDTAPTVSVVQMAELRVEDGRLVCLRDDSPDVEWPRR